MPTTEVKTESIRFLPVQLNLLGVMAIHLTARQFFLPEMVISTIFPDMKESSRRTKEHMLLKSKNQ